MLLELFVRGLFRKIKEDGLSGIMLAMLRLTISLSRPVQLISPNAPNVR